MLHLWCAGKLADCPKDVTRFRFTCLICRSRRRFYGKFEEPPYWIDYTYKSGIREWFVDDYVQHGLVFKATNGGKFKLTTWTTLKIDPRGHFTALRCAAIIVLDEVMKALHVGKPLAELCELLANYPIW